MQKHRLFLFQLEYNNKKFLFPIYYNRYRRLGLPINKMILSLSYEYKGEVYRREFNNI